MSNIFKRRELETGEITHAVRQLRNQLKTSGFKMPPFPRLRLEGNGIWTSLEIDSCGEGLAEKQCPLNAECLEEASAKKKSTITHLLDPLQTVPALRVSQTTGQVPTLWQLDFRKRNYGFPS